MKICKKRQCNYPDCTRGAMHRHTHCPRHASAGGLLKHYNRRRRPEISLDAYYRQGTLHPVVHIDTANLKENSNGPILTLYLNDDTDDPLWDNRQ